VALGAFAAATQTGHAHQIGPSGSSRVRAVLFDVDGTLYHQRPLRALMATELAASPVALGSLSRATKLARVLQAYRRAQEALRDAPANGESIASLQVSHAARQAGVDEADVECAVSEWMASRPLRYLRWCRRSGLLELLERLRRRGIRLGVLSDYPCADKLAVLGVASFFSPVLCTTDPDINAFKPNPRGFWRACDLWNLPPEEVLYVGDRPEVDARGAHAAGLRCVIVGGRNGDGAGDAPGHFVARRLQDVAGFVDAG
jgi:HAD superfamily hydrolase (TIGR01549 family)